MQMRARQWLSSYAVQGTAAVAVVTLLAIVTGFAARDYRALESRRAEQAARLGRDRLASGDSTGALDAFRRAVSLRPQQTAYRLDLAVALTDAGRVDESMSYLSDVIQSEPVNGLANLQMARALVKAGRNADAEGFYYRAIYGRWPPDATDARLAARLELLEFLRATADRNRIRADLVQLAAAFPGDMPLQIQVAQSLLDLDWASDAEQVFRFASERSPQLAAAFAGLARASLAAGHYAAVAPAARRALALDPDDTVTADTARTASAVLELDPSLPRLSTRARRARTRALLLAAQARLTRCLESAPDLRTPDRTALLEQAADWLQKQQRAPQEDVADGNLDLAETIWSDATALCPTDESADRVPALVFERLAQTSSSS